MRCCLGYWAKLYLLELLLLFPSLLVTEEDEAEEPGFVFSSSSSGSSPCSAPDDRAPVWGSLSILPSLLGTQSSPWLSAPL
ncbi:hypothetical protein XELAEV_18000197mg [Xenopus laevis]|uniref:Secreted protein n=1 Tax=Xenopus laevis TaxID=8355 RepID=A0A974GYM3_XENLA|nr:hypothetical protein XELAEV_18000197mg [Xenopus laevis]